ncbi:metal-dependent hydrolase family protein [Oceanobacillus jeddahense]|uniref:Amidohydrolase family protein n=1 Tax=Oceanobacillus jeddahense TaxID=1462527 RepID=A0ABY5JQE3_9BACI|nr:amidohydrolase family protein [Oceanobacillus jeddahense]UUI02035.1 amidohydrolase family protein [Oceanobacillus jeddahense]
MNYIINNINILYGNDLELHKNKCLWIKEGYIYKILGQKDIPSDVPVIDGEGKYVIPGLIDLHVHIMWDGSSDPVKTTEEDGYEQMIIRAVSHCQDYINNGITTIRDIGSIDDIAIYISNAVKEKILKGPKIIASGKTLTMTGGHDPFWARFIDGKDEALKGVREQIFKGSEVIKLSASGGVYGRTEGEKATNAELSLEEQTVICDEAHKFGLKVASHAIAREGILNSILANVDTIEHGHYLDEELITMMEERGIAWIPTLFVYRQIASEEVIPDYARKKAKEVTDIHAQAFKNFFNRDILIGAGSDAGSPLTPHPSLLDEILAMYETVQDRRRVLKTATVNAGFILEKEVGQIREGFIADFILLEKNPLEKLEYLKEIDCVYINGEMVKKQGYTCDGSESISVL